MSKSIGILLAVTLVALTMTGCGKNVVGPSAPEVIESAINIQQAELPVVSSTEDIVTTESASQIQASCHATTPKKNYKYNHLKNRKHVKKYVRFHMRRWLVKFYIHIYAKWYNIFPVKHPLKRIIKSNLLFVYIIFKHKIDYIIGLKVMGILSQAYQPGSGTNPGDFAEEVTLTPFKWRPNYGFYGDLLPGWQVVPNSTDGYIFQTANDNNDLVYVDTKSYDVDIYKNNPNVRRFQWLYFHDPVDAGFYKIEFLVENQLTLDRVKLDSKLFDVDGVQTAINLWNSTVNKSASYSIVCSDGSLKLDLDFDETGAGGGTLDIINKDGNIDHYEYVLKVNGHGFWIKNNGKKRCF